MAKLWKLQSLALKTQTNTGSAATPIATDYLYAMDVSVKPTIEVLERDFSRASLDTPTHTTGKASYDVSFKVELKGSGSSFVDKPTQALLEACGFYASASTNDVTFFPISVPSSSAFRSPGRCMTVEFVRDGYKRQVKDVVGSPKITCEAGKLPILEFSGKGLYAAATDVTTPTSTGSNQTLPPVVESVSLTVDGQTFIPGKFEIDCGNTIQPIDDVNSTDGIHTFVITSRKPVGSFDPLATTVATYDFLTKVYNATPFAVTATVGSAQYNRVTISAPYCQYTDISDTSRNDLFAFQLPMALHGSGSFNNYVTIKFN
jgi:hypothetical protein